MTAKMECEELRDVMAMSLRQEIGDKKERIENWMMTKLGMKELHDDNGEIRGNSWH